MKFSPSTLLAPLLQHLSLSRKIWLAIGTALLAGVLVFSIALSHEQRSFSRHQLMTLGQALAEQTSQSAAPLILAGDELSLSIVLQQLITLEQIQGVEILNGDGDYLSQVGKPSEMNLSQPIRAEQTQLGSLRLHLNPDSSVYQISELLPLTLAALGTGLIFLLLALVWLGHHLGRPAKALVHTIVQINHGHRPPALGHQRHDELAPMMQLLNQHFCEPEVVAPHKPDNETAAAKETLTETAMVQAEQQQQPPATDSPGGQDPLDTPETEVPAPHPEDKCQTPTAEPEESEPESPETDQSADEDSGPRGYLFYVNHHVGGSDTLTSAEREQLLTRYYNSLQQVARLYKGLLEDDALGNWCVRFAPLSDDQSHGINALCAAQLFNALYRGINSQAIHNFSPALNMKLVLLCGPIRDFDRMAEDALLLSDQIQENDLITHTELYQIDELQQRLLDSASYRKFDQDTLLIASLNRDYQTLIDRQAEHFLKQSG
ncbi:hypothetical protein DV711_00315 [Motiliproteus coralliicola]|uniref:HAMP domain-containing protein n=1 Tax=Motiliproteus coralliicola TaxID=2283196 RepID=A0A369WSN2_9GAMM|nr:hypothetical protein [Motiliproteus coralliicola]RDE24089.1 hypothetical protein DV711_00315 [Motiliproteus coralliicola]